MGALSVECPYCGQPPGFACRKPSRQKTVPHEARSIKIESSSQKNTARTKAQSTWSDSGHPSAWNSSLGTEAEHYYWRVLNGVLRGIELRSAPVDRSNKEVAQ